MKKGIHSEPWQDPALGPCACSQLRRTTRAVSAMYDRYLEPSGLTVTQYAILVSVARAKRITRTQLAEVLGMDRTTLTRNLRPLEREKLVKEEVGEDRRARMLQLTASGRKRLESGFRCWSAAQAAFLKAFGEDRATELRTLLKNAADSTISAWPG